MAIFPNVCLWWRSYAQNREVLTLKTVTVSIHLHMSVRPMLLHRMALVSCRLYVSQQFGHIATIFWANGLPSPLAKNFPYAYELRGGCAPPLQLSNTSSILRKNFAVYWQWSKTWEEVEEFMFNALKMVVKMVVVQPLLRRILDPSWILSASCRLWQIVLAMLRAKLVHFSLKIMPIIMLVFVHVSKKYKRYEFGKNTSMTIQVTSKWQTHSPSLSVETLQVHNLLYDNFKNSKI